MLDATQERPGRVSTKKETNRFARRLFLQCLGALTLGVFVTRAVDGDDIVIVDGWVLKRSDLGAPQYRDS